MESRSSESRAIAVSRASHDECQVSGEGCAGNREEKREECKWGEERVRQSRSWWREVRAKGKRN